MEKALPSTSSSNATQCQPSAGDRCWSIKVEEEEEEEEEYKGSWTPVQKMFESAMVKDDTVKDEPEVVEDNDASDDCVRACVDVCAETEEVVNKLIQHVDSNEIKSETPSSSECIENSSADECCLKEISDLINQMLDSVCNTPVNVETENHDLTAIVKTENNCASECLHTVCDVVDCVTQLVHQTALNSTTTKQVGRTKKKKRKRVAAPAKKSTEPVVAVVVNPPSTDQVLDLTVTKPKSVVEEERVKPIKRLSSRSLNHVFGHIATQDFLLKVPQVRSSSRTMRVAERYAPLPPQMKKKKSPTPIVVANNQSDKYVFQMEEYHQSVTEKGQKIYTCDICSGVYQRSFSLKRHYLRVHINYAHLSERDISNCGIAVVTPAAIANHKSSSAELPDLFRCHTCGICFDFKQLLIEHLKNHPSPETSSASKPYSCVHCPATFTHQHNYRKHQSFHAHLSPTPAAANFSSASSAVAYPCSYCYKAFPSPAVRKKHSLQHKQAPSHTCMFLCGETFQQLNKLREHLNLSHGPQYLGCPDCDERFLEQKTLDEHVRSQHQNSSQQQSNSELKSKEPSSELKIDQPSSTEGIKNDEHKMIEKSNSIEKQTSSKQNIVESENKSDNLVEKDPKVDEFRYTCTVCNETFTNYVNMCKHRRSAHGTVGKKSKTTPSKVSEIPKTLPPDNMEIPNCTPDAPSSTLSCNIHDNLLNYLDGKIYQNGTLEEEEEEEKTTISSETSSVELTATPEEPSDETEDPIDDDEISPDDFVQNCHKLTWEKYSFKKKNGNRGCLEVFVMEDLSHLDLGTQLIMKQKAASVSTESNDSELSDASLYLRQHLSLTERVTSVTSSQNGVDEIKLSGEWIRPRSYICCICAHKSVDLWDLEDHMYTSHYNVWWTFLALDASTPVPGDLFHRSLRAGGAIASADFPDTPSDSECTKCGRSSHSVPELHRHMLECGGDFTWMYTTSPTRRKSKWRPFGTRRRRQQGRRGMKRNIPNSPVKIHRGRIKGADSDSIQRMIANLPAKRATRRVIQFTDDEIKTRSQATINNVTFSSPFPRLSLKSASKLGGSPNSKLQQRRGRPKSVSPVKPTEPSEPKKPEEVKKKKIRTEDAEDRGIRRHLFPLEPPFICNGCGTEFFNSSSCERHAKKCVYRHLFQDDVEPTAKPSVACTKCNKIYVSNAYLEKHTKICVVTPTKVPASSKPVTKVAKVKAKPTPVNDIDMPTLQKEEPVKTSRTKKTNNIPILSPVSGNPLKKRKVPEETSDETKKTKKQPPPQPHKIKLKNINNKKLKKLEIKTQLEEEEEDEVPLKKLKKGRVKKVVGEENSETKNKINKTKTVPEPSLLPPVLLKPRKFKGFRGRRRKGLKVKLALAKLHKNGVLQEKYNNIAPRRRNQLKTKPEELPVKKQKKKKVEAPPVENGIEKKSVTTKRKIIVDSEAAKKKKVRLTNQKPPKKIVEIKKKGRVKKSSKPSEIAEVETREEETATEPLPEKVVEPDPVESEIIPNDIPEPPEVVNPTETISKGRKSKTSSKENSNEFLDDLHWCQFCNKSYSSYFNLLKHRTSMKHKRNAGEIVVDDNKSDEQQPETEQPLTTTEQSEEPHLQEPEQPDLKPECEQPLQLEEPSQLESDEPLQLESDEPLQMESEQPLQIESEQPLQIESEQPLQLEKPSRLDSEQLSQLDPEQPLQLESNEPSQLESEQPLQLEESSQIDSDEPPQIESEHSSRLKSEQPIKEQPEEKQTETPLEEILKSTHLDELEKSDEEPEKEITTDEQLEIQSEIEQPIEKVETETIQPVDSVQSIESEPEIVQPEPVQPSPSDSVKPIPSEAVCLQSIESEPEIVQPEPVQPSPSDSVKPIPSEAIHVEPVQPIQSESDIVQPEPLSSELEQPEEIAEDLQQALQLEERLTEHQHHENDDFIRGDISKEKRCPPAPPPSPTDWSLISAKKKTTATKRTKKGGRGRKKVKKIIDDEVDLDNVFINVLPEENIDSNVTLQHITNLVEREMSTSTIASMLDIPVVTPAAYDLSSRLFDELKRSETKTDNPAPISVPLPCNEAETPSEPSRVEPTTATAAADFAGYPGQYPYDWSSSPAMVEPAAPSGDNWNYNNWNGWTPSQWSSTSSSNYFNNSQEPPALQSGNPPPPAPGNQSFGDILGSVHQVLEDGASEYASSEYSLNQSTSDQYLLDPFGGRQSFEEIQKAMGATDEEMAMLQQLGQGSFASHEFVYDNNSSSGGQAGGGETTEPLQPLDNPDLIDLDNQAGSAGGADLLQDQHVDSPLLLEDANSVSRFSYDSDGSQATSSQLPPSPKLLSIYEKKEMVCPVCNRHFLGLHALETHISWIHKMKDAKKRIFNRKENSSARYGYSSLLAREPGCLVGSAAGVVLGSAGGIRGGVLRAAAGAAAEAAEEAASKKRKLACFVCKELYSDVIALNRHIAQLHIKKKGESDGLKSQMSSALGGLLDRALSNMLGKAGRNPNQNIGVLNKLCLLPPSGGGEKSSAAVEEEEDFEPEGTTTPQQNIIATLEQQDDSCDSFFFKPQNENKSTENKSQTDDPSLEINPSQDISKSDQKSNIETPEIETPLVEEEEEKPEEEEEEEIRLVLSFDDQDESMDSYCGDDVSVDETQQEPCSESYGQELTTKATPEQIAQTDPLLEEPPSDELLCPICIAAMKHYHSLVRHMKTQHCDWDIQAFSTDMYNYLIMKKDYEVIRKKYSINVPALRGAAAKPSSIVEPGADTTAETDVATAEHVRDRRPSKSGSSTSESGSLASSRLDADMDHDTIRARAYAALRQLNRRPNCAGRLQTLPIRGSKRRPLDVYEFFDDEDLETPPSLRRPFKARKRMRMLEERGKTMDLNELFVIHEQTDSVQCKNCLKSFKSMQTFWRHAKGACQKFIYGESSSDDNDSDDKDSDAFS